MPDVRSVGTFFKQNTVSNTAMSLLDFGFSAVQVAAADVVIISVDTAALRVTWDTAQTAPTTSLGVVIPNRNNPYFYLYGRSNAARLLMIRDGGSNAIVNITIESD